VTDKGDHYDPIAKVVRLSADNFNGRSVTAVTVAAHEVGHALQDARGFGLLHWRTRRSFCEPRRDGARPPAKQCGA
jgi:Zn-dependent membrane protease YugP